MRCKCGVIVADLDSERRFVTIEDHLLARIYAIIGHQDKVIVGSVAEHGHALVRMLLAWLSL